MTTSPTSSARRLRGVAIFAAPVFVSLAVLVPTVSASAADVPDAISNVAVSNATGTTPLQVFQQLTVTADWNVPDRSAPGDTFSMTLPEELRGLVAAFPLNDDEGATFGQCTVSATAVLCTLSALVSERPIGVGGSLFFSGQFTEAVDTGTDNTLFFDTGNQVDEVVVEVGLGEPYAGNGFRKGGSVQGDGRIRWYVELAAGPNGLTSDLRDVVITETLADNLEFTNAEGIFLRSGTSLTAVGTAPNYDQIVDRDDYTVEIDGKTATIRIPFLSAGVFYSVVVDTLPVAGASGTFTNRASLTATGLDVTQEAENSVRYGAGGDGSGSVRAGVTVTKFDTLDDDDAVTGDFDAAPGRETATGVAVPVTITVTGTGGGSLSEIVVTDVTTAGPALTGLSCLFPDGSTGTSWDGPLQPGVSFDCTGVVPPMIAGAQHSDTATVTATGTVSGAPVSASDSWNGYTVVAGEVGSDSDEVGSDTDSGVVSGEELAATGVSSESMSSMLTGGSAAVLAGLVLLMMRRKESSR